MKNKQRRLKRGLAIEYAIIVMVLAIAFTALILLTSTGSLLRVTNYDEYVTQKNRVDEIGTLVINYYKDSNTAITTTIIEARASAYDYSFSGLTDKSNVTGTDNDLVVEVLSSSDSILLQMVFEVKSSTPNTYKLIKYYYGDWYAAE